MSRYRCENEKPLNEVRKDDDLASLWIARLAEQGDTSAQAILASRMQFGDGFPAPQPKPRNDIGASRRKVEIRSRR